MAIEGQFFRLSAGHSFLFGLRGTGKITWLHSALPNAVWIDFLSPAQQRLYAARPERLRELVAANPGTETL